MEKCENLKPEEMDTMEAQADQNAEVEAEENVESAINEAEKIKHEIDSLNDKYLRLNAEFQNYKRRVEKEKTDIVKYGTERIMTELLPVIDNFSRAMQMGAGENADTKFVEGLGMIQKSLEEFLQKNGVKKIEAIGESFDPQKHHAVMTEEKDGCEPDTVIDVLQEGYTLNERVIRPSMVKVSC